MFSLFKNSKNLKNFNNSNNSNNSQLKTQSVNSNTNENSKVISQKITDPVEFNYKSHVAKAYVILFEREDNDISTVRKREEIHVLITKNTKNWSENLLKCMDVITEYESLQKGTVPISFGEGENGNRNGNGNGSNIYLIKEDITKLPVDAIVNAANAQCLGCFIPEHKCIDQIIHKCSGPRLRMECQKILQGQHLATGKCISTLAYSLPSKFVIHVVGPQIKSGKDVTKSECMQLENCYYSCLEEAKALRLNSIAFCCISTGLYGFPLEKACEIAKNSCQEWIKQSNYRISILFCLFDDKNHKVYQNEFFPNDLQE